jgi:hypothetical protein
MAGETSDKHPLRRLPADVAVPSAVFVAVSPGDIAAAGQTYAAPPPDTVVAPRQQGIHAHDQGLAAAVLKHDEQAAEVARLTQSLQDTKQMHAAEIERLRAEHAADLQRMVEALWQARDAARAASAPPEQAIETLPLEPRPTAELQPAALPAVQARFLGWSDLLLCGRACAPLGRIGRRWAAAFRAWS